MLFSEWFDDVLRQLELKSNEVARFAGMHVSTISRYRTGSRTPSDDQEQMDKLMRGLCQAAEARQRLRQLGSLICRQYETMGGGAAPAGVLSARSADDLQPLLMTLTAAWFHVPSSDGRNVPDAHVPQFDQKLTALMELFSVSNTRLARALSLDPSLISRWRHGIRVPRRDMPPVEELIQYFARLAMQTAPDKATEQQRAFLNRIQPADSPAAAADQIRRWLLSDQGSAAAMIQKSMAGLLGQISAWYGDQEPQPLADPGVLGHLKPSKKQHQYRGVAGLREAVTRFLSDIILSPARCHIQLFSNQNMSWLGGDPAFLKTWAMLMHTVVRQGHRIEIVHSFGRNETEMMLALEKWLPMHMNGNITAYTCDHLNRMGDASVPLIRTLFINVDRAAVSAEMVMGTEDQAEYRYYTSMARLSELSEQFEQLKQLSEPIMTVYRRPRAFGGIVRTALETEAVAGISSGFQRKMTWLSRDIPLCFFPMPLLSEMLRQAGLSPADVRQRTEALQLMPDRIRRLLELGPMRLIGAAAVPSDDQSVLMPVENGSAVRCPAAAYRDGLLALRDLEARYPRLEMRLLPELPFKNLRILALSERNVLVQKTGDPQLLVQFQHERCFRYFDTYLDVFLSQAETREPVIR